MARKSGSSLGHYGGGGESRVTAGARQRLNSTMNETNKLIKQSQSYSCLSRRSGGGKEPQVRSYSRPGSSLAEEKMNMRELLAEQRKALREFNSYYCIRGGN